MAHTNYPPTRQAFMALIVAQRIVPEATEAEQMRLANGIVRAGHDTIVDLYNETADLFEVIERDLEGKTLALWDALDDLGVSI